MILEETEIDDLENMPLHFWKIFSNSITDIDAESRLYKYSTRAKSMIMREYYPETPICKMIDFSLTKNRPVDE